MTAADLLPSLLADDPAAPRITCYDDLPGPTRGERIELSGRVLANWVAKAANALTSDFDIQPGDVVVLALPPHWRTVYWALAGWAVGASVHVADPALGSDDPTLAIASVVVTDSVELAEAADAAIVVTLAALARSHPGALPSHAMDEAAELASYPDRRAFAAPEVDPARPALITPGRAVRYDELVAAPTSPGAGSDSPAPVSASSSPARRTGPPPSSRSRPRSGPALDRSSWCAPPTAPPPRTGPTGLPPSRPTGP
ncbi:TIGR03089 family protein [Arsenicicoccus piscis]|uniref:AMP-dependent synthetase/ligase domain-containing protein n=1 Tax=Arsenicicoccus piscis TaxID=673954 RepID=A0ABQ6HQ61_9MICO|nr:TIGR03089 family protein [Arsenicicoccus piscis]GMA20317.1 hypothetical protein GCM10025862_23380 [Arsenicicoccus piscis]